MTSKKTKDLDIDLVHPYRTIVHMVIRDGETKEIDVQHIYSAIGRLDCVIRYREKKIPSPPFNIQVGIQRGGYCLPGFGILYRDNCITCIRFLDISFDTNLWCNGRRVGRKLIHFGIRAPIVSGDSTPTSAAGQGNLSQ